MDFMDYGGFWRRTLAFFIDKIILSLTSLILLFIAGLFLGLGFPFNLSVGISAPFIFSYYGTALMLNMAYFTYFHGSIGQTPGKMMLGLKVIQKTGAPMTYGIAFLRWVGYIISAIVFNLGFLWVAFDHQKRGWHDYIAGTCVVKTRREKIYDTAL